MSTDLPVGALLLARDEQGQAYAFGDQLVVERRIGGKKITTRLPVADLDWLWEWSQLFVAACERLAVRQLT